MGEDDVRANSPQGPGVISPFRGLAGISCYVICMLQITASKQAVTLPYLSREARALGSPVTCALQRSKRGLAPRMSPGSQQEGMSREERVGQPRGPRNRSSRQLGSGGALAVSGGGSVRDPELSGPRTVDPVFNENAYMLLLFALLCFSCKTYGTPKGDMRPRA